MTRDRETRRARPPDFDAYDDDAFDVPGAPSALDAFVAEGWISEILHEVKSGKEATVYCCRAQPRAGVDLVAAKVYRSRQRRTFKNDAIYRKGRVIGDKRVRRAVERKTAFGREAQFGLWVGHEWATLSLLHAAGADVPRPVTCSSNAILMEYVGNVHEPAPLLNDVSLARDDAHNVFTRIMRNVELCLAHNVVHGDLSAFNILWWEGNVTIIDVPQAVDPRVNPNARDLLARDIDNVCHYFSRSGVRADPARLAARLWARFLHAEL
jgi:RIO kinase 1